MATNLHGEDLAHKVPGARLSHYEIIDELSHGGMGVVYRARDLNLKRDVAIKSPWPGHDAGPGTLRRFVREGRAASRLHHPNIVPVFDSFEQEGVPYIVMELVEGENFREQIRRRGSLPTLEILHHAEELADALRLAHSKGVLHRDIKPGNILIDTDGRARLTDFGLVRFFVPEGAASDLTTVSESFSQTGAQVGTLAYMSPEQALGRELTPASDLFSLGLVLYEMCTGKPAFAGDSGGKILDAVLNTEPEAVARLNYEIPGELARIVHKSIRKHAEDRYQTATDLLVDVRSLRREQESEEYSSGATLRRSEPVKNKYLVLTVGLAVIAALAGAGWWWATQRDPGSHPFATGRPRLLTTAPGWETEPAISPDGSLVAYTSNQSGQPDIWLVDVHGGDPLPLTDDPAADHDPAWLPAGTSVVFVSERSGESSVWMVPRLGGQPVLVLPNAAFPAVSPDGSTIAFSRAESEDGLLRIAVAPLDDPSSARWLTNDTGGRWDHIQAAWSPDGDSICYADLRDLWIVSTAGGTPRRFTTKQATDREPVWSADGRHIFFSSGREETLALWRADLREGKPQRLTMGTGPERHPSMSTDGSRVAYSTFVGNMDIVLLDRRSQQSTAFPTLTTEIEPAIAPDGTSIVFTSNRRGRFDLWSRRMSGTGPIGPPSRITNQAGQSGSATFSPDSSFIAYERDHDRQRDIWLVALHGGLPVQLTDHPANDIQPNWSNNGAAIAFVSDRDGHYHLWVASVDHDLPVGPVRRLTSGDSINLRPVWSPDDSRLAFIRVRKDGADVWIVDPAGDRPPRRVTEGVQAQRVRWDADGKSLLVSGTWGEEATRIRRVDVATGKPAPLESLVDFGDPLATGDFDLSRDRRWIVFVQEQMQGDVWIVDSSAAVNR